MHPDHIKNADLKLAKLLRCVVVGCEGTLRPQQRLKAESAPDFRCSKCGVRVLVMNPSVIWAQLSARQ